MDKSSIAKQLGQLGGIARANKLSAEKRREIAIKASHSRKSYLTAKKTDLTAKKTDLTAKITPIITPKEKEKPRCKGKILGKMQCFNDAEFGAFCHVHKGS